LPSLEIRMLPASASSDAAVMDRVTGLVNEVYADSEKGLWEGDPPRTSREQIAEFTSAGQIAVATLDGKIVGSVRVQRLEDGNGEFGMLAAGIAHRGAGIGRELVRFAEQKCREEGAKAMQLELLMPREWSHPAKDFLAAWYARIGYRVVRVGTLDEANPELVPFLATPCDFLIYHKDLEPWT
jgi:ribosomal protein S18 acetylase RimI-like enzyme